MKLLHSARAQIVRRRARRAALVALAASFVVAGTSAPSHARREIVRWRQPQDESHVFFQVHVGRRSRAYDKVYLIGRPIHANGVYAVSIPVDEGPTYIAIRAYNLVGEGPLSNEIVRDDDGARGPDGARGRGDGGGRGGGRDGGGRGESVSWADTEELHASIGVPAAEGGGAGLELRGRLQLDDPAAGIGLTFRNPAAAEEFYWLARDPAPGTPLQLASTVSTLSCDGELPVPEPGRWYRFRFQVVPGVGATTVSAKVWRKGAREPKQWTQCTDDSAERLSYVEAGLWAIGPGVKFWDDVTVKSAQPRQRRERRRG